MEPCGYSLIQYSFIEPVVSYLVHNYDYSILSKFQKTAVLKNEVRKVNLLLSEMFLISVSLLCFFLFSSLFFSFISFLFWEAAIIWPKHYRYGVKLYPINQSTLLGEGASFVMSDNPSIFSDKQNFETELPLS